MIKKIILLLLVVFPNSLLSQNEEVKTAVLNFFEGFHQKDTTRMKTICSDKMLLQTITDKKGKTILTTENKNLFYKTIATLSSTIKFEERILSFKIEQEQAMAHVWTPYEFFVNGKLSHLGVNSFTLMLENNKWKIVHIIDTRRQ
jgi:hypothetical protein